MLGLGIVGWTTMMGQAESQPPSVALVPAPHTPQPPMGLAPSITVVGKRPDETIEVIAPAIDRYILALKEKWRNDTYYPRGHQFRIQSPKICLEISGLDRNSTERFSEQFTGLLHDYGIEIAKGCESEIFIQFSSSFKSLIMEIQRNPHLVGYGTSGGDIADLTRYPLPIRWVASAPGLGHLRHTWIFVDGSAMGSLTPSALVNYIGFVALTVPNNNPTIPSVYSIANLFTFDAKSANTWTRLDKAFVHALYSFNPDGGVDDAALRTRTISEYAHGKLPPTSSR